MRFSWIAALVVLAQSSTLAAATIVVPDDAENLSDALELSRPYDTILLREGLHIVSLALIDGADLTIQGEGLGKTILEAPEGPSYTPFILELTRSQRIRLEKMTLQGAEVGVMLSESHDITLSELELSGFDWGIASGGSYNIVSSSIRFTGNGVGLYSLWDWTLPEGAQGTQVVEHCVFEGNDMGAYIDSSRSTVFHDNWFLDQGSLSLAFNNWSSHRVDANLFWGGPVGFYLFEIDDEAYPPDFSGSRVAQPGSSSRERSYSGEGHLMERRGRQALPFEDRIIGKERTASSTMDIMLYNNIFTKQEIAGVMLESGPVNATRLLARNNVFYKSAVAMTSSTDANESGQTWNDSASIAYNVFFGNTLDFDGGLSSRGRRGESRNLFVDPRFVDPDALDYRLQMPSPCLDTGTLDINGDGVNDLSTQDYSGRSRDRGMEEKWGSSR